MTLDSSLEPVSVVIVNYNAGEVLLDCVCATLEQAAQVIVIDNGSSDSSMDMLAEKFVHNPRLVMHRTGENLGFSVGCNLGRGFATQPLTLFLNPDCILGDGSLRRMVEVLCGDASVGMVGGRLLNFDGSEQGGGRRAVPTPWRSFVRAFGLARLNSRWPKLFFDFYLHKQPLPDGPIEVEAISGALMLIRSGLISEIGGWDEAYFLHCEDLDLCMSLRRRGWKILFVPDAPVLHYHGYCGRNRPIFVEWHKHRGMVRFYQKFFRHQYPGVLMWFVIVGVYFRFGMALVYHSARLVLRRIRGG